ncbi:MAG: protein phosphatase 2C domain-containing protein, partial [Lachnospiraceae bacterium]|nr:protein phosphatase 2C domain-containing protein [Lachnospiraceae bacterium]
MDVVYYTNKGGREINEDSLFMTEGAYVVCDGLGGHVSGEVASNCAVKVLSELCESRPPYSPDLINTFYLRANQAVVALKEQALTTIVGGFVRDGVFYYQSVGDSRLYYFRDGKKYAQTKDDSVCQAAVDLGTMDYEDIRTSEDRSRLLKVLGNDPELKITRKYEPIPMRKGDAFIVCSDGFWEHVLDQEMSETLTQARDAEEWLNLMLRIQYG